MTYQELIDSLDNPTAAVCQKIRIEALDAIHVHNRARRTHYHGEGMIRIPMTPIGEIDWYRAILKAHDNNLIDERFLGAYERGVGLD